jgi:hypothetical protein
MTCTALTAASRRCSTSGSLGTTEMPQGTGESAASVTGGIVDERVGGRPLAYLLMMRRGDAVNVETMQGIADELVRIEEFPRGDNPCRGVYIITFGTGHGTYKLMYDRREVARGIEAALKRLVYEAIGRGQALCVRQDERG